MLIRILSVLILSLIFLEDIRSRSVHWFLFPTLALLLTIVRIQHQGANVIIQTSLINIGFVVVQLVLLSIYFAIKTRRWVNITAQLLGVGDILFLFTILLYLSVLNFIFFYILSLLLTLLIWLLWTFISPGKNNFIPLAGFQALIFILFLAGDWWCKYFDLTSDAWLLNLISK